MEMETWRKKYDQMKQDEIPCFSLRRMDTFFGTITNKESDLSDYTKLKLRAINFLERGYSPTWQYESLITKTNKDMSGAIISIPILLDASYIFVHMHQYFNPLTIQTYQKAMEAERNKTTGFFNYLLGQGTFICPDDVDCTSTTVLALLKTGCISREDAMTLAASMLAQVQKDDKGVCGVYFPPDPTKAEPSIVDMAIQIKRHKDVGVMLNLLCLLAELGMDNEEILGPTLTVLDTVLDRLLVSPDDEMERTAECQFYTNPFPLLAFFSNFLAKASTRNKERFEGKLKNVVRARLSSIQEEYQNPTNLGFLVIAAMNLKLHQEGDEICDIILGFSKKMIAEQNEDDGGFPAWYWYIWINMGYWGSRYVTTAFVLKALELVSDTFGDEVICNLFEK